MTLVEVRCKTPSCRRLLNTVDSAPTDEYGWGAVVFVNVCPRCHPDGASGDVASWQARRRRAGKPDDVRKVGRWVPWAELRPAVEQARRTGRTVEHHM